MKPILVISYKDRRNNFGKSQKKTFVPKEDWIIVRNKHKPLVEDEIFRIAQQMDQQCKADYQARMEKFDDRKCTPNIFRGLIFCADCKHSMMRIKGINFGKKITYKFKCWSHQMDSSACSFKSLSEAKLKEVVLDTLQQQITLADSLEKCIQKYSRTEKAICQKKFLDSEMNAARQKMNRAKRLYDSLYQNYVEKLVTEQEYSELRQKYRADMEQAKAFLERLEQQTQARSNQTVQNIWITSFQRFREETELTEEMTHALIKRIEVDAENHISVTLRYQDEYLALSAFLKAEGKAVSV